MRRSSITLLFLLTAAAVILTGVPSDQGAPVSAAPSMDGRVGIYLTSYALTRPGLLDTVLAQGRAGKINSVVVNVKNMHGEVTYKSAVPLARQIGAVTGLINLRSLVSTLHQAGIYVIARQVLFYDPKLAAHLGVSGDWVSPEKEAVVSYNLAIAQEVASLGVDEIQFDYVRFPDGGQLAAAYADRYAAIDAFLAQAQRLLSGRVALSADVFGRVMWDWNKKRIDPIGQSLEDISAYLDCISPMLYPSHYSEQRYKDNPYLVVSQALDTGRSRVSTPFRPFLQAFQMAIPAGMSFEDYIRAQIRAAQEHGADGYLFWNPSCEYAPLFHVLTPLVATQ
jgi:hypothetical protein